MVGEMGRELGMESGTQLGRTMLVNSREWSVRLEHEGHIVLTFLQQRYLRDTTTHGSH